MKKSIRILLMVALIAISTQGGQNYYVSAGGNDTHGGTLESAAWKTIGNVNAHMSSFAPGDSILFRRGDTFDDATLVINASGSAGNPIVFGAYGTGEKPVITSFKELTEWASDGDNIYSTSLSIEPEQFYEFKKFLRVMVTIDGAVQDMGRWPDAGYGAMDLVSGSTQFTDNDLTDAISLVGAQAVIRTDHYLWKEALIEAHAGATLTVKQIGWNSRTLQQDWGYYLQRHISFLTVHGEWHYNGDEENVHVF